MTRATDIDEQAARWLVRLDAEGPECADTVRAQFDAWASSDLRHRAAYLRLSAAWAKSGRLRTLVPAGAPIDPDFLRRRARRPHWLRPLWIAGMAATVVATALVGWWQFRPVTTTYRTDLGGFSRVPLLDGSVVALNTDSEIRVRLSRTIREIVLVRGEANFDVAHDRRRPFDVHVESAVVRAVGTSFDVRRVDKNNVNVMVTEGRVTLGAASAAQGGRTAERVPVTLAAGQAATSRAGHLEVQDIGAAEAARRLAWQGGAISFQGESLADAISEFNRYSRRRLELADPELGKLRVGGEFRTTDIDSFVAALHASFGLAVVSDGSGTLRIEQKPPVSSATPKIPVPRQ
jgi:transmembrane sensor